MRIKSGSGELDDGKRRQVTGIDEVKNILEGA